MADETKTFLQACEEAGVDLENLFDHPRNWENFRLSLDEGILSFCAETANTELATVLEDDANREELVGFLARYLYKQGYM